MKTDKDQTACCYWLTGLPGAGKSTIATRAASSLRELGYRVCVLDGEELRTGLNRDLGFSQTDRSENVRRISEVARLMIDAGLIVLVSAISPYRADREAARARIGQRRCFEVFIDTDLQTCVARDPKGLYARANTGQLRGLTGVDDPYELPPDPDIFIRTAGTSIHMAAWQIEAHYLWLNNGY